MTEDKAIKNGTCEQDRGGEIKKKKKVQYILFKSTPCAHI